MIRIRVTLVLVLVVALVAGSAAFAVLPAAASIGIGVTPSVLELSAKPDATGQHDLTVSNDGDQPFDATVEIKELTGATDSTSAIEWLTVSPDTIHLDPKQKATVSISTKVPAQVASGGYYAFITITTAATATENQSAGAAAQLGVPVLFTIEGKGKIKQTARLERFAPVLEPDGRLGFRALVSSSGNVYVTAQGTVQINDAKGKEYASLDFPDSGRILPGAEKVLETQGSVPVQQGASYEAAISLDYGEDVKPLRKDVSFKVAIPDLSVADMSVCENLDSGPTLNFGLKNDGALGAQPVVTLSIRDEGGGELGATQPANTLVWPTDTTRFSATYGQRLDSGSYVLVVSAQLGALAPVTGELPFQIGGIGGNPIPLCSDTLPATPAA